MLALAFQVNLLDIHATAWQRHKPRTAFRPPNGNPNLEAQAARPGAPRDTPAPLFAANRRSLRRLDQALYPLSQDQSRPGPLRWRGGKRLAASPRHGRGGGPSVPGAFGHRQKRGRPDPGPSAQRAGVPLSWRAEDRAGGIRRVSASEQAGEAAGGARAPGGPAPPCGAARDPSVDRPVAVWHRNAVTGVFAAAD